MLEVNHLSFAYRNRPVLEDINLNLRRGELLCVLGPNGAGKSTLFRCILGLEKYAGEIRLAGTNLARLGPRELARKIAYVPQSGYVSFNYTVFEMTLMGTAAQGRPWSQPGAAQKKTALAALDWAGIGDLKERGFRHLSGGEQQLCLIARAIAQQTEVFIMDEPTANLDYGNQLRILTRIKELCAQGRGVLMTTHNPDQALRFADRAAALHCRRVYACGNAKEVLTAELINDLYGITAAG